MPLNRKIFWRLWCVSAVCWLSFTGSGNAQQVFDTTDVVGRQLHDYYLKGKPLNYTGKAIYFYPLSTLNFNHPSFLFGANYHLKKSKRSDALRAELGLLSILPSMLSLREHFFFNQWTDEVRYQKKFGLQAAVGYRLYHRTSKHHTRSLYSEIALRGLHSTITAAAFVPVEDKPYERAGQLRFTAQEFGLRLMVGHEQRQDSGFATDLSTGITIGYRNVKGKQAASETPPSSIRTNNPRMYVATVVRLGLGVGTWGRGTKQPARR